MPHGSNVTYGKRQTVSLSQSGRWSNQRLEDEGTNGECDYLVCPHHERQD